MKHLKKISVLAAVLVMVSGEGGKYDIQDDSDQTLTFEIKDGKLRLDYSEMSMVMIFEQSK